MKRRSFLKMSSLLASTGILGSCNQAAQKIVPWFIPPNEGINPVSGWRFASTCRMCEAGCGIAVRVVEGRAKKVEGNPNHPVNRGGLCSRGQAGVFQLYHPERLQTPMLREGKKGTNNFKPISWEEAAKIVSQKIQGCEKGAAFAFASNANDINAAVIMRILKNLQSDSFSVPSLNNEASYLKASNTYRADPSLPYYDMAGAMFVMLFGADIFESGFSHVHYGYAYGQMRRAQEARRGLLFYAGPRMSMTAAVADHFIGTNPGELGILALGIAHEVLKMALDKDLLKHLPVVTVSRWNDALEKYDVHHVSKETGVAENDIHHAAEKFVEFAPGQAIAGDEVSSHSNGISALHAIEFLNLLSREIGRSISTLKPYSLPKADRDLYLRMKNFIGTPADARHYSKTEQIVNQLNGGEMDLGIICNVNPVQTTPASLKMAEVLSKAKFLIASNHFLNDTTLYADLVLPDLHYLETWSAQVVEYPQNVPVFSLQQPTVNPLYPIKATSDFLIEAAAQGGLDTGFSSGQEIIKEIIRKFRSEWPEVSPSFNNVEAWEYLLQRGGWWSEHEEDEASPELSSGQLWDVTATIDGEKPSFSGGNDKGFFLHPFTTVTLGDGTAGNISILQEKPDPISTAMWTFWVEINKQTAESMGIAEGDIVLVESEAGSIEGPAYPYIGIAPNVIGIPFGYGHKSYGEDASSRGSNSMDLIGAKKVDGSSDLAWRSSKVKITNTGRKVKLLREADPRGEYIGEVFQL